MSCVKPMEAWRGAGGKIVFDRVKSLSKISFKLPCGQCIGCRLKKAEDWGIRCLHEKKMSGSSCYVTLTYSDDFLPGGNTVVKRDLQLFFKRLHNRLLKSRGVGIRYFAGAEYGGKLGRPHYHALIFNYDFPDKKYHGRNMRGEPLYSSAELGELWFQGFNTIGEITMDSAIYCAKYALKKINGDKAYEHYEFITDDGVVYSREPEFALMSRRPGIGAAYYEKFGNEIRDLDNVIVSGRERRPSRYYDTKSEAIDANQFERHKRRRKRLAVLARFDNTPERLAVKERLMQIAAEKKEKKP